MKHMKLKISDNPTDQAKIEEVLRRVNGQATSHTYTSALEIIAIAKEAEEKLDQLRLPKKDRAGAVAAKTSGSKVPKAYRYRRIATYVKLVRGSRDWYLTCALKVEIYPDTPDQRLSISLTQEQDKIVVDNFRKNYRVASSAAAQSATASDVSAAA
jgi:ABC-type Na+ efflux pump permease subunit